MVLPPAVAGSPRAAPGLDVDVRVRRGGFAVQAAFCAAPGETIALLGPNGAGKTTLVGVLAGTIAPASGHVRIGAWTLDDVDRGVHVPPEQRPIGVVFQDLLLFPHLSALENVAFPLRAHGADRARSVRLAHDALTVMNVEDRADAKPGRLSGGEAQRVALARALVVQPELLLLDEPLSALDVAARGRARESLRATLARFEGVRVLVTHDPVEAMTLADRIVIVEAGRVTQVGSPQGLREAPRTSYAAELVGLNLFSGLLEPLEAGAGRLVTRAGDVIVAWPSDVPSAAVEGALGTLRPADVSLHVEKPAGSARNVLRGPVGAVSLEGDRARVRVDSSPPIVAEVTLGSVERLGVGVGDRVWASFKAVEVSLTLP
jgi:molybdate transport system ATP-binding protein